MIPAEIWLKILSYLDSLDVAKCAQVSKWMRGICLDRSLKYHEIQKIYQTTSSKFIKTLFYYKETELVHDLMSSAPDFWTTNSCWYNHIIICKRTLPVEVSSVWHRILQIAIEIKWLKYCKYYLFGLISYLEFR